MIPLMITARLTPLGSKFMANEGVIMLDALLAAKVAELKGWNRLAMGDEIKPLEIPIALESGGRFHLASALAPVSIAARGLRHVQRRFPVEEARRRTALRRVNIAAGVSKNYRIPRETLTPSGGQLVGYCIGDEAEISRLLRLVTHLGKRRAVGSGSLLASDPWVVEEVDPWDGFPVIRDGAPLRQLPTDWPGLDADKAEVRPGRLTFPYWWKEEIEELAWPLC